MDKIEKTRHTQKKTEQKNRQKRPKNKMWGKWENYEADEK